GPLLLMELAFLLRHVGSQVVWITNQRSQETNDVTYSLEHRMLNHGVQVLPARGQEAVDIALKADLVILNTAVAGKWLDPVLKDHVPKVLPKILWWIHEMRGHYFKMPQTYSYGNIFYVSLLNSAISNYILWCMRILYVLTLAVAPYLAAIDLSLLIDFTGACLYYAVLHLWVAKGRIPFKHHLNATGICHTGCYGRLLSPL
ncbi:hypothetical protein ACJX0J_015863, partial [Zea mays]